jgi:PTH2 family peptidyl-tRNA hydrolase
MKDHETPEAVEARASQEDPIVMYLIVHESLNMSTGKTAAQCAHASQMLTLEYFELKERSKTLQKQLAPLLQPKPEGAEADKLKAEYAKLARPIAIFGEWMGSSFRKVVLRASDKEWTKLKEEFKDTMVMVVDAGLTEIAAGSETVIGLWPTRKSQRSKTIQRLQVLK